MKENRARSNSTEVMTFLRCRDSTKNKYDITSLSLQQTLYAAQIFAMLVIEFSQQNLRLRRGSHIGSTHHVNFREKISDKYLIDEDLKS